MTRGLTIAGFLRAIAARFVAHGYAEENALELAYKALDEWERTKRAEVTWLCAYEIADRFIARQEAA